MEVWLIVVVLSLVMVAWDLFTGTTWLLKDIIRAEQPALYWIAIGLWSTLTLSALVY